MPRQKKLQNEQNSVGYELGNEVLVQALKNSLDSTKACSDIVDAISDLSDRIENLEDAWQQSHGELLKINAINEIQKEQIQAEREQARAITEKQQQRAEIEEELREKERQRHHETDLQKLKGRGKFYTALAGYLLGGGGITYLILKELIQG